MWKYQMPCWEVSPAYRAVWYMIWLTDHWGRRWNIFSVDKGRLEEVSVLAEATLDMYSEDINNMIDSVIFENSPDQ
jgi:hypothetical protein